MSIHPWIASCRTGTHKLVALALLSSLAGATDAEPQPTQTAEFPDMPALAADELQALRGGFEIAGLKFDFAAELRTYLDGRLALETLITYTQGGTVTQHRALPLDTAAGSPVSANPSEPIAGAGTPGTAAAVQLLGPDQGQTPAQLYLPSVDLSGLKEAAGVLVNDRKGTILALHEATRERITSLVVNQATGRDIRQELNVNVTVQNFQQFRDSLRSSILNGRLNATLR